MNTFYFYKNIRLRNYAAIQKNNAHLTYLAFLFFNIRDIESPNNNE